MNGDFNQREYIRRYQRESRIEKKVTFNRNSTEDMALLDWLITRPEGIVKYIKSLIRTDMKRQEADNRGI